LGRADLAERGRFDTWWIPNRPPRAKSALGPMWVERAIWYKVNPKSPSWSQISPRADLSGAGLIWIQITHLLIFTVFALLLLSRFCPMTPPLPTILEILASEHKQAIFGTPCTWKFFMSAFFGDTLYLKLPLHQLELTSNKTINSLISLLDIQCSRNIYSEEIGQEFKRRNRLRHVRLLGDSVQYCRITLLSGLSHSQHYSPLYQQSQDAWVLVSRIQISTF